MLVLGVDPGLTTGVALVREMDGKLVLERTNEGPLDLFAQWVVAHDRVGIAFAIVEDWEYQGPQRARGVAHQAYATGRVQGVLEAHGIQVLRVTRTETIIALNLWRGRKRQKVSKATVADWVRKLVPAVTPEVGAADRSEHEWDAVAVAVAGLGRTRELGEALATGRDT